MKYPRFLLILFLSFLLAGLAAPLACSDDEFTSCTTDADCDDGQVCFEGLCSIIIQEE